MKFVLIFFWAAFLSKIFPIIKNNNGVTDMSNVIALNIAAIKKEYGMDTDKENDGVWRNITFIPGMSVKISRTGNPDYKKLMRQLYKPYARILRAGKELPQATEDNINTTLIAKSIIRDWKGVPGVNEKGVAADVPFSVEIAMELLQNPALKELRNEIEEYADDVAAFKLEFDEDSKKS